MRRRCNAKKYVAFASCLSDEILDRENYTHMSIITQYDKALNMYRRYYQYEQIKGADRVLIEKVPEKAFREVVANALVHRTCRAVTR